MPYKIPTAHHQEQDDQQRGHEHQQGQPDVVPHLGGWGAAGLERLGGGRGGTSEPAGTGCASRASAAGAGRGRALGRHGRRAPLGSAPRGRGGAGRAPRPAGPTLLLPTAD